jgi:glutamate-1-semialdehyde 2,1-aminomutase
MTLTEHPSTSEQLLAEAAEVIPGGVNTCRRQSTHGLCFERGRGAYLWDLDGRRYVDYHAAYGAVFLGHSHPAVTERVSAAIRDTVLFGAGVTSAELELARKIVAHLPSADQVLVCNSGSEATYHAIRLARGVTGREKIVKFQGCYNGFHDYVLRNVLSAPELVGRRDPQSTGMLDAAIDATLIARFNDLDDVEAVLGAHPDEVAAVIVEPVAHNSPGLLPRPGFLEGLRALCDREGALLIFDEVITGFRHGLGGYQAIAGVLPDLTTLGKAIANGFPIAAIAGRRELMERYTTHPDGDVHFGGTFNGNAVAVEAALATIEQLEDGRAHERRAGRDRVPGRRARRRRRLRLALRPVLHGGPAGDLRRRAAQRQRALHALPARAHRPRRVRDAGEPRPQPHQRLAHRGRHRPLAGCGRGSARRRARHDRPSPRGVEHLTPCPDARGVLRRRLGSPSK